MLIPHFRQLSGISCSTGGVIFFLRMRTHRFKRFNGHFDLIVMRLTRGQVLEPQSGFEHRLNDGVCRPACKANHFIADAGDDGRDVDTWADHAHWNEFWRDKMSQDETGWQEFVDRACAALEIDPGRVDIHGVLELSREIAHAGARPMAPVSAHLWGLAAGATPGRDLDYLRRVVEDAATSAPLPPKKEEK